jgi:hypothetical protein
MGHDADHFVAVHHGQGANAGIRHEISPLTSV